jgi:DNA-binding NarL/FixJ family response regulator
MAEPRNPSPRLHGSQGSPAYHPRVEGTTHDATDERSDDRITIVIADDHRSYGEALEIALDREDDLVVLDVVDGGADAIRSTTERHPDVVLMDLRMPHVDGIEATRRIREEDGQAAIIILTGDEDELSLARAIEAGARGSVSKAAPIADVVRAVRHAHRGEPLHRPNEVHEALRALRTRTDRDRDLERRVERLTPRELQILDLIARGVASDTIATDLGVSRHTLRTHVQNILTKLAVHSKTEAVVAAIRTGKITPPDLAGSDRGTPEAGA